MSDLTLEVIEQLLDAKLKPITPHELGPSLAKGLRGRQPRHIPSIIEQLLNLRIGLFNWFSPCVRDHHCKLVFPLSVGYSRNERLRVYFH